MPVNLRSIPLELSVDDKRRFNESQGMMIVYYTSSYQQIRETMQEYKSYSSNLCTCAPLVTSPPRSERRLCSEWDGATKAAKYTPDEREASSRGRAVEVRGRNYALARILSRCIYCTRQNIAYTKETSPQARTYVIINPLLSTVQYCRNTGCQ